MKNIPVEKSVQGPNPKYLEFPLEEIPKYDELKSEGRTRTAMIADKMNPKELKCRYVEVRHPKYHQSEFVPIKSKIDDSYVEDEVKILLEI